MTENEIASPVLDAAFLLHTKLDPGLLETVVLAHEMRKKGLSVERQLPVPIVYDGIRLDEAFRIDLLVGSKVIVELKSVECLSPPHVKQLLTQLRLANFKLGLLINFGERHLKNGIKRIINRTLQPEEPSEFSL
ncbi:MAG: GxxExxY protein [Verrucomicrobia bacterium]|nr:MAG: GxxExxY protein [Verrucomicrobiota bacterium]PYL48295.1 MAG: GxxExxY protein [Verrucomicrobiota bacterium]